MNPIIDYLDKCIATYEPDPPSNDYQRGHLEALKTARHELELTPIPILLFCPSCGEQHIDAPDEASGWLNPPHRSHLCHGCGTIWRAADVATRGVAEIDTKGVFDNWTVYEGSVPAGGIGTCELCSKPLAHGQFVNQYDDVGTAHANCDAPFSRPVEETPAPGDDGTTMPTYVLLGDPALLYDVAQAPAERVEAPRGAA